MNNESLRLGNRIDSLPAHSKIIVCTKSNYNFEKTRKKPDWAQVLNHLPQQINEINEKLQQMEIRKDG